jgi:hypothetical protein
MYITLNIMGIPHGCNKIGYDFKNCENVHSWISLSGDLVFSHQQGIYGFKFPKRFLEISSRDLTSSLLFAQS